MALRNRTILTSDTLVDPRAQHLGDEMEPGAPVWVTYVEAAKEYDDKKVDEWNKSLDVLLIFVRLVLHKMRLLLSNQF